MQGLYLAYTKYIPLNPILDLLEDLNKLKLLIEVRILSNCMNPHILSYNDSNFILSIKIYSIRERFKYRINKPSIHILAHSKI